ncbi:uncharacterized protein LOC121651686 [Melanotaenia boesemani]|uniref:uncharacterized protein LOC121651686 n=1 Tax=Melanotaenia boesemani TaxID=1250792 RepID=UPI001C03F638|nr:uncharacterized protein LOC121651686 [Melanotaenia boesemani]
MFRGFQLQIARQTSEMENTESGWASGRFSTYFGVFVIFLVFDQAFECSCNPQQFDCNLHISLPVFTAFVFMLWTDRSFHRVGRHLLSFDRRHTCSFLASSCVSVIKAAFIALLWVVYVLIGGDWYACCMKDQAEEQLACRAAGRLTDGERAAITELKNKSRSIGSFLLFGLVCVPALASTLGWRKPSRWERQRLFYKLILEQEGKVLEETLRKYARERLTEEFESKIRDGRWEECFNVAEQLIKMSAQPERGENGRRADPGSDE